MTCIPADLLLPSRNYAMTLLVLQTADEGKNTEVCKRKRPMTACDTENNKLTYIVLLMVTVILS